MMKVPIIKNADNKAVLGSKFFTSSVTSALFEVSMKKSSILSLVSLVYKKKPLASQCVSIDCKNNSMKLMSYNWKHFCRVQYLYAYLQWVWLENFPQFVKSSKDKQQSYQSRENIFCEFCNMFHQCWSLKCWYCQRQDKQPNANPHSPSQKINFITYQNRKKNNVNN